MVHPPSRPARAGRVHGLLLVLAGLAACEPMEPSGALFEPVREPPPAVAPAGDMAFPTEAPLTLSSEQMAEGTVAIGTAASVDADTLPLPAGTEAPPTAPAAPVTEAAPPAPVVAPPAMGLPPVSAWPVRLVSTLPQAQPPRAILGLPSGEERVVSPGSMVPELGLVVMAVTADRVSLAKIVPGGDHAVIESIEVAAQYPAR